MLVAGGCQGRKNGGYYPTDSRSAVENLPGEHYIACRRPCWLMPEFKGKRGVDPYHVRPGSAEQGAKAFLFKMPVVGENLGQPFPAHRLHRNAID
jgi:hypothetical protein